MPKLVTLSSVAATTCCCRRVRSKSVSAGFRRVAADAGIDERAPAVHVLLAGEAPAFHLASTAAVLYGQSNLFERILRGTSTSIPPTASTSSSKRSKSTKTTWLTSRPVRSLTVRSASAGPPIWFAALILASPTSGISTWRSRGIER